MPPAKTNVSNAPLLLPPALPDRGLGRTSLALDDADVVAKRTALACHASQQEAMPDFLGAFVRRTEPYTVLTPADMGRVPQMIEHPERP